MVNYPRFSVVVLLHLALVLCTICPAYSEEIISVQVGAEGSPIEMQILAPNFGKSSSIDDYNVTNISVPDVQPLSVDVFEPLVEVIRRNWPHILTDSEKEGVIDITSDLDRVIFPEPRGPIELTGTGQKEIIATSDGTISIEALLSTFNPAFMTVRLVEEDGSETLFNNSPLFEWRRPDADAYAPAYFMGREDRSSMFLVKPGDYDPAMDLSYDFNIERGQRLIIETGGRALAVSFIRVTGDNLVEVE